MNAIEFILQEDNYCEQIHKIIKMNFNGSEFYNGSYADFYYIDILSGLNHTHNRMFQVTNEMNSSSYCNCELDSHICGFYDFPYNDDNYHIHQCLCDFDYVEHEFVWISSDTKQCTLCRVMISNPSVQN